MSGKLKLSTKAKRKVAQRPVVDSAVKQQQERALIENIFRKHNLTRPEAIVKLSRKFLVENRATTILIKYKGWIKSLKALFPEREWEEYERKRERVWADPAKQRAFLDSLYTKLNFQSMDDWYRLTNIELRKLGGRRLLYFHNESLYQALIANYPEHDWNHSNRVKKSQGYWRCLHTQRQFLDELYKRLQFSSMEDWYSMKAARLAELGGKVLLHKYGNIYHCLKAIYPEIAWDVFRCQAKKRELVEPADSLRFVAQLQRRYRIDRPSDWYRISNAQLRDHFGNFVISSGGLISMMERLFPDLVWPRALLHVTKKSQQFLMFKFTQQIYPHGYVIEEYTHPQYRSDVGTSLTFDLYLPTLNIAFEYQGEQHYHELFPYSPLEIYRDRDKSKIGFCAAKSITLINVPFWWDGSIEALNLLLRSTIYSKFCK